MFFKKFSRSRRDTELFECFASWRLCARIFALPAKDDFASPGNAYGANNNGCDIRRGVPPFFLRGVAVFCGNATDFRFARARP